MSTLYENILALCKEKGITGGKMCVDIGISKSLMTSLKTGRTKTINSNTAQKIADYFQVPVGRVFGINDSTYEKLENAAYNAVLTEQFDRLSTVEKEAVLSQAQKEKAAIDIVDDDLREYLDELRNRPEKRLLFSVTKNATKSQIEAIVKMIEEMQGN